MYKNSKRIAKNTILLYARMIVVMIVTLYTSRVVINALGIDDFGIYTAVGGFVAMFAVISNSLSAAISRYITFELGKKEGGCVTDVLSVSLFLQIGIGLLLLLVSFLFGLDFVEDCMTIPLERLHVAKYVFLFSVLMFVVNLLNVPFISMIIAFERMNAFAYIGVLEVLGRFGIAMYITQQECDKLILYSFLLFLYSLIILVFYILYCRCNFIDCKINIRPRFSLIKEIFSFTGWNFVGSASGVLRDQGVNLLLNVFYGLVVNASRGIAMQVSSAVTQFTNSFTTALTPQITKLYASGEIASSIDLVLKGARFSFFLVLLLVVPLMLETEWVLVKWLNIVPEHTVCFVRLVLINVAIDSLSSAMITLMLATGRIRNYQIIVGGCLVLNFPISYLFLKYGCSPESVFIVSIVISILCLILRLIMLNRMLRFPIRVFLNDVVFRVGATTFLSLLLPVFVYSISPSTSMRVVILFLLSVFSTLIAIYCVGLTKKEREFVFSKIKNAVM